MSKKFFHGIRIAAAVINFTLFLIGIAILGSSIYLYFTITNFDVINAPDHYLEFKRILCYFMGIGIFTIILSLVGCLGAYQKSQIVLSIYFVITLLLFASVVAIGGLYLVYKDEKLFTKMKISIDNYKAGKISKQEHIFLNSVQKMLKCCGVDGIDDYTGKDSVSKLPFSCCDYEKSQCKKKIAHRDNSFTKGCREQYKEFSQHKLGVIFMMIISTSLVGFLGMIFAVAICFFLRYSDKSCGYVPVKRSITV